MQQQDILRAQHACFMPVVGPASCSNMNQHERAVMHASRLAGSVPCKNPARFRDGLNGRPQHYSFSSFGLQNRGAVEGLLHNETRHWGWGIYLRPPNPGLQKRGARGWGLGDGGGWGQRYTLAHLFQDCKGSGVGGEGAPETTYSLHRTWGQGLGLGVYLRPATPGFRQHPAESVV